MKAIIVGAGDVGSVSANTISQIHDVLIIEKNEDVAEMVKSRLNVSVYVADGTNPQVLAFCISTHGADIVLAATDDDANNLFICMMVERISHNIRTVASVTDPDFIIQKSSQGFPGVDFIITPELIAAKKMYRLATLENAVDYEFIETMGTAACIFAIQNFHNVVGKIVMELPLPPNCTVFGIYRDGKLYTRVDTMDIRSGDHIAVFGTDDDITIVNEIIGVYDNNKEFAILGGSIAGFRLAKMLSEYENAHAIKIVDKDSRLCNSMSKKLDHVMVVNADFTDPEIQQNENLFKADCTLLASRKDDTNLLLSMSGQKYKARKLVARYSKKEYEDVFMYTGLDSLIGYPTIISNEITKIFISDENALVRLRNPAEMFFTYVVSEKSKIVDRYLGDLTVPEGVRIVGIQRKDGDNSDSDKTMFYPKLDFKVQLNDAVIVFTCVRDSSILAELFGKDSLPEL